MKGRSRPPSPSLRRLGGPRSDDSGPRPVVRRPEKTNLLPARAPAAGTAYLSPAGLADELRVSTKTIYRWAAEDPTIPQLRMGTGKWGTLSFPRERVMHWFRTREGKRTRS